MKPSKIIGMLLFFVSCMASAQTTESDKKEISRLVKELYRAMVAKDRAPLENLTDQKLTYGHSSGAIENRSEYVEAILSGPFDFKSLAPEDENVEISGDTGIVRHIFVAKGSNAGTPTDVRIGVLMVWQKQNGKWLLLARQAYKL